MSRDKLIMLANLRQGASADRPNQWLLGRFGIMYCSIYDTWQLEDTTHGC